MSVKIIIKIFLILILLGFASFTVFNFVHSKVEQKEKVIDVNNDEGNNIAPFVAIFSGVFSSFIAVFASRRQKSQKVVLNKKATRQQIIIMIIFLIMVVMGIFIMILRI